MSTSVTPCATPAMVVPPGFNMADAVTLAGLVETAYDQFDAWAAAGYPSESDWTWSPPTGTGFSYSAALWGDAEVLYDNNWEPFGFVAWDGAGNAYVVYRGTMTTADEYKDAEVAQTAYTLSSSQDYGYVHEGFFGIYQTLSPVTLAALDEANGDAPVTTLWFTGHSMGSGLATLAVADVFSNWSGAKGLAGAAMYNFASPRVGDPQFACAMNGVLSFPFYRVVNSEDVVPATPPAASDTSTFYEHVGEQATFTAQYLSITGNHSMADCYLYAVNNPGSPQGPQQSTFLNAVTGFANGRRSARAIPNAAAAALRVPAVTAP